MLKTCASFTEEGIDVVSLAAKTAHDQEPWRMAYATASNTVVARSVLWLAANQQEPAKIIAKNTVVARGVQRLVA